MTNERYFSDPQYAFVSAEVGKAIQKLIDDVRPLIKFMLSHDQAHAGDVDGYDGLDTKGTFEVLTAFEHLQRELHEERFLQRFFHAELMYYRRVYLDDTESDVFRVRVDNGSFALGSPRVVFLAILLALEQELLARSLQLEWAPCYQPPEMWYRSMRTSLQNFIRTASVWRDDQDSDVLHHQKADVLLRSGATDREELPEAPVEIVVEVKGANGVQAQLTVLVRGQNIYSTALTLPSSRIQTRLVRKPFLVKASQVAVTSTNDPSKLLPVAHIQLIHPKILAVFNTTNPSIVQTIRLNEHSKDGLWYTVKSLPMKNGRIVGVRRSMLDTYQTLTIDVEQKTFSIEDHRYGEVRTYYYASDELPSQVQYGVLQNRRHDGYETHSYHLTLPNNMMLTLDHGKQVDLFSPGMSTLTVLSSKCFYVEAVLAERGLFILRGYERKQQICEMVAPRGVSEFYAVDTGSDLWVAWKNRNSMMMYNVYLDDTYSVVCNNVFGIYTAYDSQPRIIDRGGLREVIVRDVYGKYESFDVDGDVVYACIADRSILVVHTVQGKIWFYSLRTKRRLDVVP